MHNRRSHLPALISVIASLLIMTLAFMWFGTTVGGRVNDINISYLSENTSVLAAVFKASLDEQLALLNSEESSFDNLTLSDSEQLCRAAESITATGSFDTVGVLNLNGDAYDCLGTPYAQRLPEGFAENAVSGSTIAVYGSRYAIGIPIKQSGKVAGAIFGISQRDALVSMLSTTGSVISRSCLLLDKDGKVIAVSDNAPYEVQKLSDMFSETNVARPAKGSVSTGSYSFGIIESTVAVTSVGTLGTYIAEVVGNSSFKNTILLIRTDCVVLMLLVVFAFLIMALSLMYLARSNTDMIRANERFKLVTVESQDLVFDYDFRKQQLTLDGSIDSIAEKNGKNVFTRAETLAMIDRVHDEDKEVRRLVAELPSTDYTSVRGEFRYRCTNGAYSWFRMKGTVVRANDGAPIRFIGSLINADDIMNREMLLQSGNDMDSVTGIYSKAAFYDHVNSMIRSASDSDLFAIYIIDIDGFRAVNDLLGHATGDQVLADVAKKLCIVFSDKDFVGRIGGDEYAAFLHLSSKARTVGMNIIEGKAKAICEHVRGTYTAKNKQVSISASVGVSIYPYSGRDYNTLFRNADKALRRVKDGSKDDYAVYSPDDDTN